MEGRQVNVWLPPRRQAGDMLARDSATSQPKMTMAKGVEDL